MFGQYLTKVRSKNPMVHSITNFVTVNDVANVQLACGASPCMANHPAETADMTAIAQALNINMGNPTDTVLAGMVAAGRRSNDLGHPVVLDPVAVGTTPYRTFVVETLLREIRFTAIKGNASEMRALMGMGGHQGGVDAVEADKPTEANLADFIQALGAFAKAEGCVAAVSGPLDLVTDGQRAYVLRNGHPKMEEVTGTGCMLSGLIAAFLGAAPEAPLEATVAAMAMMGVAGEMAWERMQADEGNVTYRNRLIDAVNLMRAEDLDARIRVEKM